MLVLAASTSGKELTLRLDPRRRRGDHLNEISVTTIRLITIDARFDGLTRKGEGDEDDPIIRLCNSGAEVGEGNNLEFYDFMIIERLGDKFFGALREIARSRDSHQFDGASGSSAVGRGGGEILMTLSAFGVAGALGVSPT